MTDAIATAESPPTQDGLRDYLSARDVPCPGCGYNLRGVQDSVCPECGTDIALSVTKSGGGRGWLWLLILALGWTLVAAGMHATRSGFAARDEARVISGMQVLFASSFTGSFSVGGRGSSGGASAPIVVGPSTTTTPSRMAAGAPITINRSTTGLTTSSGPVTIATGPQGAVTIRNAAPMTTTASPGLAWSQVRVQTWTTFGISVALALAAAVVLLIAILRRRSIVQAGPSRLFLGVALGIFAVYAAGQVFLFARDITG